jgi:hypothetical protein
MYSPFKFNPTRIKLSIDRMKVTFETHIEWDLWFSGYWDDSNRIRKSGWLDDVSSMEELIESCRSLLQFFKKLRPMNNGNEWENKERVIKVLIISINELESYMDRGINLCPVIKNADNILNGYYPNREMIGAGEFCYREADEIKEFFSNAFEVLKKAKKAKSLLEIELLSAMTKVGFNKADELHATDWFDDVTGMPQLIENAEHVLQFVKPIFFEYEITYLGEIISELKYAQENGIDLIPWVKNMDYLWFMHYKIHGFPDSHQIDHFELTRVIDMMQIGEDPTKYLRRHGWRKRPPYRKVLSQSIKRRVRR